MATKKQSTRSEDSGWLLEVGVIGIDKTLRIIQKCKKPLFEVEQLLRPWENVTYGENGREDVKLTVEMKKTLPFWKKIREIVFSDDDEFYDLWEEFDEAMIIEAELKQRKGKKDGKLRRPLIDWRLDYKTFKLLEADGVGYNRNRFYRIKAESIILWDAIQFLNCERKSMPKSYPDEIIQKHFDKKNQEKVRQIIVESLHYSKNRKLRIEKQLQEAKESLKKHDDNRPVFIKKYDEKREDLLAQMALLNRELKKWGSERSK